VKGVRWPALALASWLLFFLFFLALTAAQLTAPGPGKALLSQALAAVLDLDAALPHLEEALHRAAQEAEEPRIAVPDFPVPVEVTREEALALQGERLRSLLLREAAARVYHQGMGVLAAQEGRGGLEAFSLPGAIDRGLGLIGDETHLALVVAAALLGVASLALALPLLRPLPAWGRLGCLGGIWVGAGLPALALGLAARLGFRALQRGAEPFVHQLLQVGVEAASVLVRNALALSALGTAFLALAALLLWAEARAPSLTGGREGA